MGSRNDFNSLGTVVRRVLGLLFVSVVLAGVALVAHPRVPAYQDGQLEQGEITVDALPEGREVLWVDARSQAAYEAGHVEGAVLLNEDDWNGLLDGFLLQWQGDEVVVVYCDGGECHASKAVADRLRREFGLEEVYHLRNGWDALAEAGRVEVQP